MSDGGSSRVPFGFIKVSLAGLRQITKNQNTYNTDNNNQFNQLSFILFYLSASSRLWSDVASLVTPLHKWRPITD